jgi:hypothetical protein
MAVASLILGIASLFCFGFITGIIAIILGGVALSKIGRGEASGKGMAIAGLILGIIGLVGWVIWLAAGGPSSFSVNTY